MKNYRSMMAIGALASLGMMVASRGDEDIVVRLEPTDIAPKRKRNLDTEGPAPAAGPPTASEADMPSRQQRRWQERQAKKRN